MRKLVIYILSRVFPERLAALVGYELALFWKSYRLSPATARKLGTVRDVMVNVGCGERLQPGWINIDQFERDGIYFWDCRKRLPFADNAAKAIFTEHFLEHLEYEDEAPQFLRDCHRCLAPGGTLRVVVPDAGAYLREYSAGGWDVLAKMRPLSTCDGGYKDAWLNDCYTTRMEFINAVFRQRGEHKYGYDAETLIRLLRAAGFSDVTQQSFGVSLQLLPVPDTADRATESLYVEAVKSA